MLEIAIKQFIAIAREHLLERKPAQASQSLAQPQYATH